MFRNKLGILLERLDSVVARFPRPLANAVEFVVATGLGAARNFRTKRLQRDAAFLAYFALLSLIPFLSLLVWITRIIAAPVLASPERLDRLRSSIFDSTEQAFPFLAEQVTDLLGQVTATSEVGGILGLVAMLGIAGLLFRALSVSVSEVYDQDTHRGFVGARVVVAVALLAAGVVALGLLMVREAVAGLMEGYGIEWYLPLSPEGVLVSLMEIAVVVVGFVVTVRVSTRGRMRNRPLLVGGVLFWLSWVLSARLFGLYLEQVPTLSRIYGSLTAVAALLLWTYYTTTMYLFCVCVAAEIGKSGRGSGGLSRLLFVIATATLLAAVPVPAGANEVDVPVIAIHEDSQILSLFAPYKIGHPINDGWHISGVNIPATSIEVSLENADGRAGVLRLLYPDISAAGERSRHFLIRRSPSLLEADGRAAADAVVKAIKTNDSESLWTAPDAAVPSAGGMELRELDRQKRIASGRSDGADEGRLGEEIPSWFGFSCLSRTKIWLQKWRLKYESLAERLSLSGRINLVVSMAIEEGILLWFMLVGFLAAWTARVLRGRPRRRWVAAVAVAVAGVGLFPVLDDPARIPGSVMLILLDGVTMLTFVTGVLAVLTVRRLRGGPPRTAWFLFGILAAGAVLRVFLSEPTLMTAWPYTRFHAPAAAVYQGPLLSFLTSLTGAAVSMAAVLHGTTLVLGILGPWAVFLHAHHLTGDDRAALAAAAILAVLPAHIRFSASDVVFIPSIVFSALALVFTHMALYDPSPRWRVAALLVLPLALRYLVVMRPLNLVFLLVMGGVVFWLRPGAAPLRRRWLVAVVGLAPALLAVAAFFTGMEYWNNVDEGLSLHTLWRSLEQLVDPVHNTLVNPWITPPLFGLAAFVGSCFLIRKRWRLGVFLLAWLGGFFLLHSYVVPLRAAMTARYHLHLTVPFVILAGAGVSFLLRWNPRWSVPLLVVGIASAGLNLGFIRDVEFTVMEEYSFVRKVAHEIPDGCWVIEPLDMDLVPSESRFGRATEELSRGQTGRRVNLIFVDPRDPEHLQILARDRGDDVEEYDRALLLEDPPACVYFYQGFKCWDSCEPGEKMAPGCEPPDLGAVPEIVAVETHFFRFYDDNNELPLWTKMKVFRPALLRLRGGPGALSVTPSGGISPVEEAASPCENDPPPGRIFPIGFFL